MRLFRHPADRIPVLLFSLLFACDLAVYFLVENPALLVLWTLVGILPKGWVCAWNHHHQHVATFEVSLLNRLLELVFGLQTGMTAHAWMLHHTLGHHPHYLDQQKDESRWRDEDGRVMGVGRYTLEVTLTSYTRAWEVSRRYPHHRPVFVGMGLATLAALVGSIVFHPLAGICVFLVPMLISLVITSWATYTHHAGRSTENHFVASTNILHPLYNVLTGNLGYHTAHHYRGGAHWSELPKLHAEIAHLIPADAYLTPGFPMSLGPQRVDERGATLAPAE